VTRPRAKLAAHFAHSNIRADSGTSSGISWPATRIVTVVFEMILTALPLYFTTISFGVAGGLFVVKRNFGASAAFGFSSSRCNSGAARRRIASSQAGSPHYVMTQ